LKRERERDERGRKRRIKFQTLENEIPQNNVAHFVPRESTILNYKTL
jgi:hypothetical protein